MTKVRVRYAPSPTGFLHIGNARTALFNYLFAKHYDGEFIIRIEDTDLARNIKGSEISQLKNLKWLGIDWHEGPDIGGKYGPYKQSERINLYQIYAQQLLQKGMAYKEYKSNDNKNFSLRFKVPKNKIYYFDDLIRGNTKFHSQEIEDWIIIKENGMPTYNFAVVIDDFLMNISHVLRGEEHITNTPKQIMVYQSFGWKIPVFCHMTLILNENKKKLSKRDTQVVQLIKDYKKLGYLPNAMFNFLSLLGFSPKSTTEILSVTEIIKLFDKNKMVKSPAIFDVKKLNYINSQYIKKVAIEELVPLINEYFIENKINLKNDFLEKIILLFKDRIHYLKEIFHLYKTFFLQEVELDSFAEDFLRKYDCLFVLQELKIIFQKIEFKSFFIEKTIKDIQKSYKLDKKFFMFIRIATTLRIKGPSLPFFLELLERQKVLYNIETVIMKLSN